MYLLSDSQSGLQAALNITAHHALRYHQRFNPSKTNAVVVGSKIDMAYFKDISPWTLYGKKLNVVETNEHLGLLVSGLNEEQKNVDNNITKCRNSLFAILGPAFAYKCLLNPVVQTHIWRTCHLPILLSGLPALPIRSVHVKSLSTFHKRIMRGFLKLSKYSPVPALYFLLGELPVEGVLHCRTLGLLHNVASNPNTTVYAMIKYILMMCEEKSTTWSNHVTELCMRYDLPPPLALLESPPSKESWKELVKTKVTIWHERNLRDMSLNNSKMCYLNVQLLGLSGQPHPALVSIHNTQDIRKLRLHLKFLCGDFMTNDRLTRFQPGSNPACSLCGGPVESYEHVLLMCRATSEIRERLRPDLLNAIYDAFPNCRLLQYNPPPSLMLQFLLDCTSPNLPNDVRIAAHNPYVFQIFRIARDWCYGISNARCRLSQTNVDN